MTTHHAHDFQEALLRGDRQAAATVLSMVVGDPPAMSALEELVVTALDTIGSSWEQGQAALSKVYISTRICEDLMSPYFPQSPGASAAAPEVAIAVLNDHHLLGKRIVLSFLKASGVPVQDWGSCSEDQLVGRTLESRVRVLLISTLMLPSALKIRTVRERLRSNGFNGKIIVGGAPFRIDPTLVEEVGADATADNAMDCVKLVKRMLQEVSS